MITVFIRKRQKPYGYQTVKTVNVATQAEADEIIKSWENVPYAYATTVPQRKAYRTRYERKDTPIVRSATAYIESLK